MMNTRRDCIADAVPLPRQEGTLKRFKSLLPGNQGRNLALTVLFVLRSLDSGHARVQIEAVNCRKDQLSELREEACSKSHPDECS